MKTFNHFNFSATFSPSYITPISSLTPIFKIEKILFSNPLTFPSFQLPTNIHAFAKILTSKRNEFFRPLSSGSSSLTAVHSCSHFFLSRTYPQPDNGHILASIITPLEMKTLRQLIRRSLSLLRMPSLISVPQFENLEILHFFIPLFLQPRKSHIFTEILPWLKTLSSITSTSPALHFTFRIFPYPYEGNLSFQKHSFFIPFASGKLHL